MTDSLKLDEVQFIHKVVDNIHYLIGNDEWTHGLVIANPDYTAANIEAMKSLRDHLRIHHDIRQGEWEFFNV